MVNKGLRYDNGKLRLDLIPTEAIEMMAEVYTKGAHKYSIYKDENGNQIKGDQISFEEAVKRNLEKIYDGADNWRKGLPWRKTLAAVKRHILKFEKGQDYDDELLTHHLGNALWGLATLAAYTKIYPQGDDRLHPYLRSVKIGLDIDDCIADFLGSWTKSWGIRMPSTWYFDRQMGKRFEQMKKDNMLDDFYMNLNPLVKPEEIPFEPFCYITSRPVSTEVTENWLDLHGFPCRPVYTVEPNHSKSELAKSLNLDFFIDDKYENFVDLNKSGICTMLYTASHNVQYDVGYKRVNSFIDFNKKFLEH